MGWISHIHWLHAANVACEVIECDGGASEIERGVEAVAQERGQAVRGFSVMDHLPFLGSEGAK